jgi:hypothetical protein
MVASCTIVWTKLGLDEDTELELKPVLRPELKMTKKAAESEAA